MGGKGGEAGNPAPFVPSDGGVRRARPAGPPGRSLPGLSKLFLALAGPRPACSADYGQRRAVAWTGALHGQAGIAVRPADDAAGGS